MTSEKSGLVGLAMKEGPFIAGAITTAIFLLYGKVWLTDLSNPLITFVLFGWLFLAMLWGAFGVVRHADCLAELLGEPYGTLILTVAVITIEVALISAIMLTGNETPELARDTMMAVIMIVLNLMIGLALLLGGLRHREQVFNFAGARAYLGVIIPLATLSLIMPNFTHSTNTPTLTAFQSIFFAGLTVLLYATFLGIQTIRHQGYFMQPSELADGSLAEDDGSHGHHKPVNTPFHAIMLVLTLLPIVLLSKKLAVLVDYGTAQLGAPAALGGVLVAILVLAPEGLAALEAASQNKLQRSVNICLGSALATISLTVPAVVIIGLVTGDPVVLGLDATETVLLCLTLLMSIVTFGANRTTMLQGMSHFVVFVAYMVLLFDP